MGRVGAVRESEDTSAAQTEEKPEWYISYSEAMIINTWSCMRRGITGYD